ncbi:hypothetical protein GW916_00370 [bacterium]|nr:hypothetical protein [bacterium]
MSRDYPNPIEEFSSFFSMCLSESWVHSVTWAPKKRPSLDPKFSKSHKEAPDDAFFQVEVESPDDVRTGIDLEFYDASRPLFKNKDWLERRLKIPEATIKALSSEKLLEEWCYREAAFKALYPFNEGIVLSDFIRESEHQLSIEVKGQSYIFDLKGEWKAPWFVALARRSI